MEQLLRSLVAGLLSIWVVLGTGVAHAQGAAAAPTGDQQNEAAGAVASLDQSETSQPGSSESASAEQRSHDPAQGPSRRTASAAATGRDDNFEARTDRRRQPSAAAASAVVGRAAAEGNSPDDDDNDENTNEDDATKLEIGDAVLRWGLNNESNTRAYAPGTFNFMSAGKLGDPGQGAQLLPARRDGSTWMNGKRAGWTESAGNVSLQKWDGSAYRTATFAGTSTDSDGKPLRNGTFSNHQLVFSKGEGDLDLAAKTAKIRWTGDATILYYSGYAFFYLSDPELVVSDGSGKVTAALSGFSTSMEDMSKWEPVKPKRVTIADLGAVKLTKAGFTSTPKFDGVRVSGEGISQVAPYGSFPQSFITFQNRLGTAAYWYTSGGSADRHKTPLPMTFAWQGSPAKPPAPDPGPPPAELTNRSLTPPKPAPVTNTVRNITIQRPGSSAVPRAIAADAPLARSRAATLASDFASSGQVRTLSASAPSGSSTAVLWWSVSAIFIALAVLSLVTSYAYTRALTTSRS